jgi:hypothetical protein
MRALKTVAVALGITLGALLVIRSSSWHSC